MEIRLKQNYSAHAQTKNKQFPLITDDDDVRKPPHFDGRSRVFEIDSCSGFGKVCLVYRKSTPGISTILFGIKAVVTKI